jgi:hypothetical protein
LNARNCTPQSTWLAHSSTQNIFTDCETGASLA